MDFKSFIIGLVVGVFSPYMDDLIKKIFSKSPKKNTDSTPWKINPSPVFASIIYRGVSLILFRLSKWYVIAGWKVYKQVDIITV